MVRKDHFTLGDEIKKKYYFDLYPYNLRAHLSPRNLVIINHFRGILDKFWGKNQGSGEETHGIFFNKVISELIRQNPKLNFITHGWYLYGVEVAKPSFDQSKFIPQISDITRETGFSKKYIGELDDQIIKIAKDFDPCKDHFDWERKQYENFKEKIYLTKLDIQQAIKRKDVKLVNKKLSLLYICLRSRKFDVPIGALTMMSFIDIAKKVIISNNYKIPNLKRFNLAFDESWKCFAVVNLYLTSSGDDAEKIRINASRRTEESSQAAEKKIGDLIGDIKFKSGFQLQMGGNSSEIVSSMYKILQDG